MLSRIPILLIIAATSPTKSIIVEFKPCDFASEVGILWKYYTKGGDPRDKAYIVIPQAIFAIKPIQTLTGLVLSFEGTFIEDKPSPWNQYDSNETNTVQYNSITVDRYGIFEAFPQTDDNPFPDSVKLHPDTLLRYNYQHEITKKPPYVAIRYASLEEIQTNIADVFQDLQTNDKYFSQATYAISHGEDGHFLQFYETSSPDIIGGFNLVIGVLFGSISYGGSVVTITSSTTEPLLSYNVFSRNPLEDIEGALGVRMATIGVLAKRDRRNKVSLFTVDNLNHSLTKGFTEMRHEDIVFETYVWSDCFVENPPSRLEKGFKVVIKGHVFTKRCGFPINSDNEVVNEDGRKIIIEVAAANSNAKFTRSYDKISRSSSQLFFGKDHHLYMIANNTKLLIDKFVKIKYYF